MKTAKATKRTVKPRKKEICPFCGARAWWARIGDHHRCKQRSAFLKRQGPRIREYITYLEKRRLFAMLYGGEFPEGSCVLISGQDAPGLLKSAIKKWQKAGRP